MEHGTIESGISLKTEPNSSAFTIPTSTTIRYPTLNSNEGSKIEGTLSVPSTILGTRRRRSSSSRTATAKQKEPAVVARRNARERRRVKMVNDGFIRLRKHVPTDPKNKKLSKVKTLRSAIDYIRQLQQMLNQTSKPLPCDEIDPAANSTAWLSAADMKLNQDDYQEALFSLQRTGSRPAVLAGQTFCTLD